MFEKGPNEKYISAREAAAQQAQEVDYSKLDRHFTGTPEEATEVQSGSLKACHSRTLGRLQQLQGNTEMLQTILYKIDGARPPQTGPSSNGGLKGNADKEPDHPTFTARKIEGLLESEISMQRAIMDQINRSIG